MKNIKYPVSNQGRRPQQYARNANNQRISVTILVITLLAAVMLGGCATSKTSLPFATQNREGKYPVYKNKPVKNKATWTCRQWGHEGR